MNKNYGYYKALKYYIVGLVSIILILFFCYKVFFIPTYNKNKYYFYEANFSNVEGLNNKTPVMLFGYKIGMIKKIYLDRSYNPIVVLAIDKKIQIPEDSSISIKEDGFIGNKVLQLNLGINDDYLTNRSLISYTNSGISLIELVDLLINYISNLKDNVSK